MCTILSKHPQYQLWGANPKKYGHQLYIITVDNTNEVLDCENIIPNIPIISLH